MKHLLIMPLLIVFCQKGYCQFDNELKKVLTVICVDQERTFDSRDSLHQEKVSIYLSNEIIKHIPDYMAFHRLISIEEDKSFSLSLCERRDIEIVFDPFSYQVYHGGVIRGIWAINRVESKKSEFEISYTSISEKRIENFPYKRYVITYSVEDSTVKEVQELKPKFVNVVN